MAELSDTSLAKNCQICAGLSDIESRAWASPDLSFLRRVSLSLVGSLSLLLNLTSSFAELDLVGWGAWVFASGQGSGFGLGSAC
jgi:hypothetical protein